MTSLSNTIRERVALPASAHGPGGGDGPQPTAADIFAMLRRRTVLIVSLFVLFLALTGGGFAVWWIYFPGYRGEALIECISNIPEAGLTIEQQRLKQDEHERFVMTQALLLKSPGILGEALKITAVRETDWFRSVVHRDPLLELTDELQAYPVRGTNLLRVAMECRNPKDPAVIVNEVVRQWFRAVKKRSAEEATSGQLEVAQQELETLDREVAEARGRLQSIAARLPAGASQNPSGNITNQRVNQYAEQVAQLNLELALLEQFRAIYNDPVGVAVTAEDRALVELDPQVAEMARALLLLEQNRAAAMEVYGSEHGLLRQIDARITALEAKLDQLRTEKLNERRTNMRQQVNTAYDTTRHALFLAQENLLKEEAVLQDQDRLLFDYFNLEEDIRQKVEYRQELLAYIKNLMRVKTQETAVRVNVEQPAVDPLERHSPTLWLIPLGVLIALTLSIGIALGMELLDTSVRTSQDVVRHLDVALLGLVPHTDDEETAIKRVETAVRDAPRSMVAEAFRRIRTNLQFTAPALQQRTILVASPRPHDGKTTVACNLAIALAQGGRRVLLVDANLRRAGLKGLFDQLLPEGLSNLLIGEGSLSSYAVGTNTPLLDVLSSGPTPPNPAELLGSELCRVFLQEAAANYDQVIIDSSPVLLTSDAMVLATAVDGVILVVRANQNSRGAARRACRLLTDVGAHLFGTVLNAAQVTRGGYFREELRSYYDYQSAVVPADSSTPSPRKS